MDIDIKLHDLRKIATRDGIPLYVLSYLFDSVLISTSETVSKDPVEPTPNIL
jgi:hypothetical protein